MSGPNTPTYKTLNWPAYNKALKRRGSLAIWFDPDMVWAAKRLPPGGVTWLAVGIDVSGRAAYSMQCAKDESRALAHEAARAMALSRLRASLDMPGFPAWQKVQADA